MSIFDHVSLKTTRLSDMRNSVPPGYPKGAVWRGMSLQQRFETAIRAKHARLAQMKIRQNQHQASRRPSLTLNNGYA